MTLKGKTMFISGVSRGIGLSIAKRVESGAAAPAWSLLPDRLVG
jgi:NAD(P)-dependent dehydrogenase (short-subunit alcohol dehydrogenase family)